MIDVASKEHGDSLLRAKVQIGVLALAELERVGCAMVRDFQNCGFGKAEPSILPDRCFPVLLQPVGPEKDHRAAVLQREDRGERIGIRETFPLAACDLLVGGREAVLLRFFRPEEVNPDARDLSGLKIRPHVVVGQLPLPRITVDLGKKSPPPAVECRDRLANRGPVVRELTARSKEKDINCREGVPERTDVRVIPKDRDQVDPVVRMGMSQADKV